MEQLNFHKQKLYALIAAGAGIIGCFLPWWSLGFFGSINGLHDIGILVFLGFAGAGICSYLGDRTLPFDGQLKTIAAGCFAGAALFTLIQLIRVSTDTSVGIWLCLISGIAGAVIVWVVKPEQFNK